MTPYATLGGGRQPTVTLYQGDTRDVLARLPAASVSCIVTSPPYWGLRSYLENGHADKARELGREPLPFCANWERGPRCTQCWVCKMVGVFEAVKRVLRDDGTLWLNVGDAYARTGPAPPRRDHSMGNGLGTYGQQGYAAASAGPARPALQVPEKNLLGLPWRLALALQAAGWWLRQDIIWAKKAPLPESVQDRCTKSHEYLFLLAKQPTYYFDAEAIKEKVGEPTRRNLEFRGVTVYKDHRADPVSNHVARPEGQSLAGEASLGGRNKRSVWHLGPEPYTAAHYATFPQKLVEPCVLAGSPVSVCSACLAPWRRVVERHFAGEYNATEGTAQALRCAGVISGGTERVTLGRTEHLTTATTGWQPSCLCQAPRQPATILDPFVGSGTVPLVALQHGRASIGIDLSRPYLDLAVQRLTPALAQLPLFAPTLAPRST